MDNKHQILFKESLLQEYPYIKNLFSEVSGNDRAKALLAMADAFAKKNAKPGTSVNTLYHLAEAVRSGYDLNGYNDPVPVSEPKTQAAPEPVAAPPAPVVSKTSDDYDDWAAELNSAFNPPEPKEGGN